jgi:hypothetical protein
MFPLVRFRQSAAMRTQQRLSDLSTGTELACARTTGLHEAFADTTSFDDIIRMLEEEALAALAPVSDEQRNPSFNSKTDLLRGEGNV